MKREVKSIVFSGSGYGYRNSFNLGNPDSSSESVNPDSGESDRGDSGRMHYFLMSYLHLIDDK